MMTAKDFDEVKEGMCIGCKLIHPVSLSDIDQTKRFVRHAHTMTNGEDTFNAKIYEYMDSLDRADMINFIFWLGKKCTNVPESDDYAYTLMYTMSEILQRIETSDWKNKSPNALIKEFQIWNISKNEENFNDGDYVYTSFTVGTYYKDDMPW